MKEKIKVIILKSTWSIESPSPGCLKLLAWLKMAKIDHSVHMPKMGPKSKTGKAPYIVYPDGTILDDSERIIEHLSREYELDLDSHLSAIEQAQALCLRRMFEDHLYFNILYDRWETSFDQIRGPYFAALPGVLKPVLPTILRKQVKKDLKSQGTGRRPKKDILMEAKVDLDAISTILGESDYFFGKPSSVDAVAFAFLENLINTPLKTEITEHAKGKANLVAFCERFRKTFF